MNSFDGPPLGMMSLDYRPQCRFTVHLSSIAAQMFFELSPNPRSLCRCAASAAFALDRFVSGHA
jgi:hypothetical protein